jgi:hypothetical protein
MWSDGVGSGRGLQTLGTQHESPLIVRAGIKQTKVVGTALQLLR